MATSQSTRHNDWLTLVAGVAVGLLLARRARRLRRFVVADESMLPQLRPGDRLLVLPLSRRGARPGDVVIVSDPELAGAWLVKRVAGVLANGRLELRGDNARRSRDSRAFGPVAAPLVVGRAVLRYLPGDRRDWVR